MFDCLLTRRRESQMEIRFISKQYSIRVFPLMLIAFRQSGIIYFHRFIERNLVAGQREVHGQVTMLNSSLSRPLGAHVLRINGLYGDIDGGGVIRTQVNCIFMQLAHVSVKEATTATVFVSVCCKDVIAADSSTYADSVSEVTDSRLFVRPVAPCDGQLTVFIA